MSTAAELCRRSEEALVLSDFSLAEAAARQALAKAAYLARDTEGVADRAATVAIQALAETERFGSARKLLRESFGPSLHDVPPNALLVWLALALDAGNRGEAQREILALLDSRQPGSATGWSRRQFLALAHLYVFEVLLREMREVAEVMRWVENTQLPLDLAERRLLLDELEEERAQQAQQAQQVWQAHSGVSAGGIWGGGGSWGGLLSGVAAVGAGGTKSSATKQQPEAQGAGPPAQHGASAPAQQQQQQQQQQRAAPGSKDRLTPAGPAAAARAGAPAVAAPAAAAAAGTRQPAQAAASEIEPAEDPAGQDADPASTASWLGQWQRQVAQLLAAVLGPLLPSGLQPAGELSEALGGQQKQPPGADPAASLSLLGSTVLGVVLLYAAYAERRAIQAGARRAQRGVMGGLGDMVCMAFSMQINPLASSAAGFR